MKHSIVGRVAAELRCHSLVGTVLLAAAALIVGACNNGSGGTGY